MAQPEPAADESAAAILGPIAERLLARHLEPDAGQDPCCECECCYRWIAHLAIFAASCRQHVSRELRLGPCSPECLVCAQIDWQGGLITP